MDDDSDSLRSLINVIGVFNSEELKRLDLDGESIVVEDHENGKDISPNTDDRKPESAILDVPKEREEVLTKLKAEAIADLDIEKVDAGFDALHKEKNVSFPTNDSKLAIALPAADVPITVNNFNVMTYALILSLCGFPLGWDVGTTGSLVEHNSFRMVFGDLESAMVGTVVSSFNVGCLIGCLSLAQLKINLKLTIALALAVYALGVSLEMISTYLSPEIWVYISGRFVTGISCGTLSVVGPIYVNELTVDASKKRVFLSFFQTSVCTFILLGNLTSYLYDVYNSSFVIVNYVKWCFIASMLLLLFFIPNSMSHYINLKREDKLKDILEKIYKNPDVDLAQHTIKYHHYQLALAQNDERGFLWALKGKNLRKTVICCCLMGFQQITGINYFFYYGNVLFNSTYSVVLLSMVNLGGALCSLKIIEKFSIKRIMIVGSFFMSVLMILYSSLGNIVPQHPDTVLPILIVLTCLFIFSFSISWGPCCGVLNNLISDNRNDIIGLSISFNWSLNFLITIVTPTMIKHLGFNYGFIFAFNLIVMGIFVCQFL